MRDFMHYSWYETAWAENIECYVVYNVFSIVIKHISPVNVKGNLDERCVDNSVYLLRDIIFPENSNLC